MNLLSTITLTAVTDELQAAAAEFVGGVILGLAIALPIAGLFWGARKLYWLFRSFTDRYDD